MDCKCIGDIVGKLVEMAKKKGVEEPEITFDNGVLVLANPAYEGIGLNFTCHGKAPKKYATQKGQPIKMMASFCPFCGKPVEKK